MQSSECLAYFLDAEDLGDVLVGWPREIDLALCLDDSGRCELVVFHRAESGTILLRVAQVLGRAFGTFCVTPEVEGHPTRRMLFSEEQDMMGIIRGAPRLAEIAEDYLINYRFAVEEGLDTDLMTTGARIPAEGLVDEPEGAMPQAAVPDTPTGEPAAASRPQAVTLRAAIELQGERLHMTIGDAHEFVEHHRIAGAAVDVPEEGPAFTIVADALSAWDRDAAALVDLPASALPGDVIERLEMADHALVDIGAGGIAVTPVMPVGAEIPPAGRPRRGATPLRLAMGGLLAIGLISGSVVTAYQAAGPTADLPGTRAAQVAAASDVALELIGTFAHADERE
ncbi:hypothetical protein [Profundibacterium mesophilum]|uniref:Uncharacterized protein n=1 Tax=Profundibacterium mesophilum KAUST100406-0324 TaxID=1037889 RepID=A0A921NPR3_9RHOB|nr:hypothetical protein [Profundibacterium mesophilum]KAF0674657.1 hypothetical protein PMES_03039 [Profundibacterium mesophilum KAUST100406-0324]